MSPSFCPRRFAASRFVRVLALLAWLLMTVSTPAVSAGVVAGPDQHEAGMASMAMGHAMHAGSMATGSHHTGHCCGNASHPACHCEAMCAAVLLPCVQALHGPARLATVLASKRGLDAPTPEPIPPLRPPAA